jgi:Carboxypeptidase regulatory-like domain
MKTSILIGILILALLPQGPQNPSAPGSVEGIVRNAETREPIADVEVSFAENFEATVLGMRTVRTDASGRFVLNNVEPNKYTLIRKRFGYFTPKEDEWWEEHPRVEVGPSQRVTGVVLELIPGGTISGRVFDSKGEPVAGTRVSAAEPRYVDGIRRLEGQSAPTDEQGRYRIFGLFPGSYYLQAEYVPARSDVLSPRVSFPGTFDESASRPLIVRSGVELTQMDITFPAPPMVPTFTIGGVVTGIPAGNEKNPRLRLTSRDALSNVDGLRVGYHQREGGRFQIRGVPAGTYDLYAWLEDEKRNLLTAKSVVSVQGDADNLTLSLQHGVTVQVRVTINGSPPAGVFKDFEPELIPVTGIFPRYYNELFYILEGYRVDKNSGRYVLPGISPGRYRLKFLTRELQDSHVADIRQNGRSVFDDGFSVGTSLPEPVEIVVSRSSGRIEGTVRDARGNPVAHPTVALVPSPPHRNNSDLYRHGPADLSGKFSIDSVRPGAYKVFAWDSPPYGEPWQNADFIAAYEANGVSVQVEPDSATSVQVTVIPKGTP